MRVAASVVLAGLIVVGVSACEFITPQDTTKITQVADGMNAQIGAVTIGDALMFTADGTEASLVTTFVNSASTSRTVQMQYATSTGTATQQVVVPANGLLSVRPGADQSVTFSDISTKAGALFPVYFTSGASSTTVQVPVLNGTLQGYHTLLPSPTPTPTPSPSGSAHPGKHIAPTASPTPTP